LDALVADGESDELVFVREARRLMADEGVRVLFACLTSTHRRAIEPVVQHHRGLLVYPGESEGLEQPAEVVGLGPLANQHVIPAIRWCRDALKKRRFYLVGSDTVYARAVRAIVGDEAPGLGVEIVGDSFVRRGDVVGWVVDAVHEIEKLGPE